MHDATLQRRRFAHGGAAPFRLRCSLAAVRNSNTRRIAQSFAPRNEQAQATQDPATKNTHIYANTARAKWRIKSMRISGGVACRRRCCRSSLTSLFVAETTRILCHRNTSQNRRTLARNALTVGTRARYTYRHIYKHTRIE